ncbi:MAG: hypothetical protein Q6L68_12860, partial [Thermostichus sp. DG02_5_bins_236]
TPDELWAEVQKRQAESDQSELSDEELESVAGGVAVTPFVKVSIQVVTGITPSIKIPKPKW